jgi:hypothetical protein
MNIEDVRKVFGAVAPPPVIAERKSNLIPALMLVALIGIGVVIYIDSTKNDKEATLHKKVN